jgi:hypothetical protein
MATAMMDEYKMMSIVPHQNSETKYSQEKSMNLNNTAEEDIHLPNNKFYETKTKLPTIEQLAMLGVTITEIAEIYDKTIQTMYKFAENNAVVCYGKFQLTKYKKTAVYSFADFVIKIGDKWAIDTDAMICFINSFGNNVDEKYVQMFIHCIMEHKLEIENALHKKIMENTREFVMRDIDVCDDPMQPLSDEIAKKNAQIEELNSKIKDLESILEKQAVSVTPKVNVHQNDSQKLDIGLSIDITVNGKKIDIK